MRPTAGLANEKISLGAVLDVRKDGKRMGTLRTERGYYPSQDTGQFGPIGRFFEGESTSEVGLRAGVTRDLWTAIQPDIGPLMPIIAEANRRFAEAPGDVQALVIAAHRRALRAQPAARDLPRSSSRRWSPGSGSAALIAMVGALIALWPAGAGARRRVTAGYAARVAQELGRARVRA